MKKQYVLIFSVVLNILFVLFFVGKRVYYSTGLAEPQKIETKVANHDSVITITYNKYTNFDHKRKLYDWLTIDKTDITFLGDSETELFPLNEKFKTTQIKNRGITGSEVADVLKTASGLPISNNIFLMAGINDIYDNVDEKMTIKNYEALLDLLKQKNPSTTICVQSVLPIADKKLNEKVMRINQLLEQVCKKRNMQFIDMYNLFLSDGVLKKDLTVDGTHLTSKGYTIWFEILKKQPVIISVVKN